VEQETRGEHPLLPGIGGEGLDGLRQLPPERVGAGVDQIVVGVIFFNVVAGRLSVEVLSNLLDCAVLDRLRKVIDNRIQ
jgi:hypothetical protein